MFVRKKLIVFVLCSILKWACGNFINYDTESTLTDKMNSESMILSHQEFTFNNPVSLLDLPLNLDYIIHPNRWEWWH